MASTSDNTSSGEETKTKRSNPFGFTKAYLIGYNFIETIGWLYLLCRLAEHYILETSDTSNQSIHALYTKVKWPLFVFQNAAILEVVHAAIRIVPSNPIVTAIQVASRIMVVIGVLWLTEAAKHSIGLPLCLLAWSLTEVIRYGSYTLNLLQMVPYAITWLRYTLFIVLYPIGITGELLCLNAAQREVGETQILTIDFPNPINFIFHYRQFLWFIMFLYIPLFPQLYKHMFSQRRRVLGSPCSKKTK